MSKWWRWQRFKLARALYAWSSRFTLVDGAVDPLRARFHADGLATVHTCPFLDYPDFKRAYAAGEATGSWGGADIRYRAYVACWAARQVACLPGDFVECGVNRGGLSRAVIEYLDWNRWDRRFWLVDTYKGLDARFATLAEREGWEKCGFYKECYEQVKTTFKPFNGIRVVRGAVPEVLDQVTPERVAYLSIDMNCVLPEQAALDYFWPRLVPGAVIVLDDYAWQGHEAQQCIHDAFAQRHGLEVLALPTGQGLIWKGPHP